MKFVQKALDFEITRQEQILKEGESVVEETRSYDPHKNLTTSMRSKETVEDYRYFPEPDLPPYHLSQDVLEEVRASLPELPVQLKKRYLEFGISLNEAESLSSQKEMSDWFEILYKETTDPAASANWLMGPVKSHLNEVGGNLSDLPLSPKQLTQLINAINDSKIPNHVAKKEIFPDWISNPQKSLSDYISSVSSVSSDSGDLQDLVDSVLREFPNETKSYLSGKKKLFGFLMGELMKKSKGRIDPKKAKEVLTNKLSKG